MFLKSSISTRMTDQEAGVLFSLQMRVLKHFEEQPPVSKAGQRIVIRHELDTRVLFAAFSNVENGNDRRVFAVVFDWPGVAAHQNFGAVSLVMYPILFAAVLGEVVSGVVECPLTFVCGPYFQRSHVQELVARIAVMLNGRGIDGKEFQAYLSTTHIGTGLLSNSRWKDFAAVL